MNDTDDDDGFFASSSHVQSKLLLHLRVYLQPPEKIAS